ncbi:MAG: hypothetical protein GXO54_06980 [Chloroflexi bacterium]|nr:hypothetical protein [Chloroflexota bacterium]
MADTTASRALWRLTDQGPEPRPWPASARSLDDATRLLPPGFYTTFRTFDHKRRVLGLRQHLRRLYAPLSGPPPVSPAMLRSGLRRALAAFPEDEARVRLVMVPDDAVYALLEPLPHWPPEIYSHGVATIVVPLERPRPWEKRTDFIRQRAQLIALMRARGAFEALMAPRGRIREGLTSNFFWIRDGILHTAKQFVLRGVTRQAVLQVAREMDIPRRYRALPVEDIPSLDEAFLTSSSRGIVPIVRIDEHIVGSDRPGPLTRQLMDGYTRYVQTRAERI